MNVLTWTCHICGRERPDNKISVMKKPLVFESGVVADQNIRYCNDNPSCRDAAPHFDFFSFSSPEPEPEPEVSRWTRFIHWFGFGHDD